MSEGLWPVMEVPELITEDENNLVFYKKSYLWDFVKGDFVRNGANQIQVCDGFEAYRSWCIKVVFTERYECLAYPDEIGTEIEEAMQNSDLDTVASAIERTVTESIMVNPLTEYVRGFDFDWEGDSLYCSFYVKGMNYDEFNINVEVNTNGGTI